MESKIVSIDREKPIGKLVGDYADNEFKRGFWYGIATGIICMSICYKLMSSFDLV